MFDGESRKRIVIECDGGREKDSVTQILNKIEDIDDVELQDLLNVMPHEVMDLKDALRRSGL